MALVMATRVRILVLISAFVLGGCCGGRASGKQYSTPHGATAYVKCRSDEELCYEHAALLCGSRNFEILSRSEELGGACSPSFGFLYTWYKMNIACRPPRSESASEDPDVEQRPRRRPRRAEPEEEEEEIEDLD
jgi:hypothetical protein